MPHVVYQPELEAINAGDAARIIGPEAHHAVRVKRLEAGDVLALRNGRGLVADAIIKDVQKSRQGDWVIDARVERASVVSKPAKPLHVYSAAAKGDRLEEIVDGLSQVGATAWTPIATARTVVEPRSGKMERLGRVAEEALKQSGRAWLLEIGAKLTLGDAIAQANGLMPLFADQSGKSWREVESQVRSSGEGVSLFVGPEGGWTQEELAEATRDGAVIANFGPHVMRIEVAAVAGAAVVLHSL